MSHVRLKDAREPGMHQDLVDRDPLALVHLQHPGEEVLRQAGDVLKTRIIEINLSADDQVRDPFSTGWS